MKIGIIVDGDAESQALVNLIKNITIEGVQIIRPIYVDIQPKASADQIAKKAHERIPFLRAKDVDKIIVMIDREDTNECVPTLRASLEEAFGKLECSDVSVIIKDRKMENWLIADIEAIQSFPGRFQVTNAFANRIKPNKADRIKDAEQLLNSIVVKKGPEYHKRRDALNIMAKQDAVRISCNSRSFRRLLRLLSHPLYLEQSKRPHPDCKSA